MITKLLYTVPEASAVLSISQSMTLESWSPLGSYALPEWVTAFCSQRQSYSGT